MGKGRILLVEDEEPLRLLLAKYLNRIEYEVDAVGSAEDAWRLFAADPTSYALLLVDLTLPGMKGDELMREALAASATVRVLLASGYPYDLSGLAGERRLRATFLQKPFLPKQLSIAINELLGND